MSNHYLRRYHQKNSRRTSSGMDLDSVIANFLRIYAIDQLNLSFAIQILMRETEAEIFTTKTQLRHHLNRRTKSASEDLVWKSFTISGRLAEVREEAINKLASQDGNQTSVDKISRSEGTKILQDQKNNTSNHQISLTFGRVVAITAEWKVTAALEVSDDHLRALTEEKCQLHETMKTWRLT